jgi:hypothetical protein
MYSMGPLRFLRFLCTFKAIIASPVFVATQIF